MSDERLTLAGEFPAVSHDDWLALVEKALGGAPFDKKLVSRTYDGLAIQPIYTRRDWPSDDDASGFPGLPPFTRGAHAAGRVRDGWDLRQVHGHPDPKANNAAVLTDLERGVTSIELRLDAAGRAGLDSDDAKAEASAGRDGIMLSCLDDLERTLADVRLDLAPVALDAGAQFLPAAALLLALWQKRGLAPADARGALNADPIGALAADGRLPTDVDTALTHLADLARHVADGYPQVTAVGVDTSAYYNAGASETQDLACAMATGVAYLRALTDAGLGIDTACRLIAFRFSLDADLFAGIAKLRAARKMWARIAEASGATANARGMTLQARTADRVVSRRDPWVNLLRTTATCFAAAVGGADSITTLPYDAAAGLPSAFGQRIARNTQLLLLEESSLNRVIDPAGGAWYVESLTDQMARAAWAEFQAIEAAGGIVEELLSGALAARIAMVNAEREKNLARRKDALTGVSEFPNIHEDEIETAPADLAALRADAATRLPAQRETPFSLPHGGSRTAALVKAASSGVTLGTMAATLAGAPTAIDPLPRHRAAQAYEELRDAADAYRAKTGDRPRIFVANLGSPADYTGRNLFARNLFEAGGIEAADSGGFDGGAAAAKAFTASKTGIAVICSSDTVYEGQAAEVAMALKQAGATRIYLAGRPGENQEMYENNGIDDFVYLGCDILQTLRTALAHLGVLTT